MDLSILKKRNPLLLLLGQLVSAFGSIMQHFALSLYVLDKTGSATQFASVLVVSIIPRLVLSPFAGVVVDRLSRKKMIVVLDMISGIITLGFAALFFASDGFEMWMIYTLTVAISLTSVFFEPAIQAMIPDIVPKDRLADVNSMVQLVFSVLSILAPIAAGALYRFGIFIILVLNGISFILSSISEMFIAMEHESIKKPEHRGRFFSELHEGFRYLWHTPVLLVMMLVAVIANFSLNPIFSVAMPVVLRIDLGVSDYAFSIYNAVAAAGPIIGSLIAPSIIKKVHFVKIVPVSLVASGILVALSCFFYTPGLFGYGYVLNMTGMLVLFTVMMVGIMITNLSINTARQQMVPGNLMGRVSAVTMTVAMIATPAGQIIMGPMVDTMKVSSVVLIFSAITVLSGILAFVGFGALRKRNKVDMTLGLALPQEAQNGQ